mgnify:CR=1 FL=1
MITRLDATRVAQLAGLVRGRVPVAQWPAEWFEVQDQVRRADVLLGPPAAPGAALAAALALPFALIGAGGGALARHAEGVVHRGDQIAGMRWILGRVGGMPVAAAVHVAAAKPAAAPPSPVALATGPAVGAEAASAVADASSQGEGRNRWAGESMPLEIETARLGADLDFQLDEAENELK